MLHSNKNLNFLLTVLFQGLEVFLSTYGDFCVGNEMGLSGRLSVLPLSGVRLPCEVANERSWDENEYTISLYSGEHDSDDDEVALDVPPSAMKVSRRVCHPYRKKVDTATADLALNITNVG